MAKYRQLYTEFWKDGFVLDLEPEEKYFYLYLLTNANTSQCGIYELPKKIIESETGYNRETVDKLLKKFQEYKKIIYSEETKEIIILNWVKYNEPNNINAIKCVNKEIKKIKNRNFVKELYVQYSKNDLEADKLFYNMKNSFISMDKNNQSHSSFKDINKNNKFEDGFINMDQNKGITRGYEGAYEGLVSKQIINNKEEVMSNSCCSNKEKESKYNKFENNNCENDNCENEMELDKYNNMLKNNNSQGHIETTTENTTATTANSDAVESCRVNFKNIKSILAIFENNIHKVVPMEYKKIIEWSNKFSYDLIIMAIEEAIGNNIKNIRYIEKILYTWFSKGLTSPEDIKDYKIQWTEKKNKVNSKNNSVDHWNYDGQRQYDFQKLERKLLGWCIA